MRQARTIIICLLILALGGVAGYQIGKKTQGPLTLGQVKSQILRTQPPSEYQDVSLDALWEVWSELQKDYLHPDKIQADKMVNGAISGMTASLGDPYTTYLAPEDDKRVAEEISGAFGGVGIELGFKEETLAVVAPLPDTPAAQAGVLAGDLILHVKDPSKELDADTSGWSLTEAVEKIRGQKGTPVTLTLYRKEQGGQPFDVTLIRQEIVVKSVELKFVEHAGKKVAHVKLIRFGERTQSEWDAAVGLILAEPNVKGVILDMRNNPGGLFEEAINISSDFVETGVVVKQKGKYTTQDFTARGEARLDRFPVEVLVNKGSASASEIVAGALRDNLGAKLFGETTFGKGTVQDRRNLENGGGLHVTIAEWLMPKGESIHGKGLPVTVEVKDIPETPEDEVLFKAIEEL